MRPVALTSAISLCWIQSFPTTLLLPSIHYPCPLPIISFRPSTTFTPSLPFHQVIPNTHPHPSSPNSAPRTIRPPSTTSAPYPSFFNILHPLPSCFNTLRYNRECDLHYKLSAAEKKYVFCPCLECPPLRSWRCTVT